jgi:hypothetical protein
VKRCCTCHQTKPIAEFHKRSASPDGRQARCRECAREHYAVNVERLRRVSDERITRVRADNQRRLADHLAAHPCVDCGEDDLRVLDFDHRQGVVKRANIARMLASVSWKVIETEIAKCDVRCANCHRRRTSERGSWWRERVQEQAEAVRASAVAARLAGIAGQGAFRIRDAGTSRP